MSRNDVKKNKKRILLFEMFKNQSLEYILEGLVLGLTLATLLGPIFVVLINTSMNYGARAGLVVGSGIWVSDLLFILFAYFFINKIQHYVEDAQFKYWVGNLGGFILITMGITQFFKKAEIKKLEFSSKYMRNLGFFGKGFVVNTFNPFTFVFWFGVIGSKLLQSKNEENLVLLMCTVILGMIIFTDSLKILGAKWLSGKLKLEILAHVNKLAGILLIAGGFLLISKVQY